MLKLLVRLVTALMFANVALALPDPTRPPSAPTAKPGQAGSAAATFSALPSVRYLLYSGQRRLVMLDQQLLAEGQRVGNLRVLRINPNSVLIELDGRRITLPVVPSRRTLTP